MLAPRELPEDYAAWNRRWGAPTGTRLRALAGLLPAALTARLPVPVAARAFGPFGLMWNATTRRFEYPWTYFAVAPRAGLRVLEVGGGIAGLQFVLAKQGCEVHNVDPFADFGSGSQAERLAQYEELNRAMGTEVHLHRTTLPSDEVVGPFDVVYSVSTIEHIPHDELERTLRAITPLLRQGGRLVVTVDLFLDVAPFCSATSNRWGTNVSLRWIEEVTGLRLCDGERAELFGYDEFSTDAILVQLERYNLNTGYPTLAQCAVFEKP